MVDKLAALFEFCEAQISYLYPQHVGSAAVLAQLANGTFSHGSGEKSPYVGLGGCYKYVKVALKYRQIVDVVLGEESGSAAGGPLLHAGFVDVTNSVPDHRWAAAGDVVTYRWSEDTWEQRRRRYGARVPNHGHVEIRHTEHYYSDFRPRDGREGKTQYKQRVLNGVVQRDARNRVIMDPYPEYVDIRIYRKVFDIIPTLRIKAFLRCIRDFECTAQPDDAKRYKMMNTHLPGSTSITFESFETHPWADIPEDQRPRRDSGRSTACGAYQITCPTWHGLIYERCLIFNEQHWFTPEIQDRMAVIIIESMPERIDPRNPDIPNALRDVRAGRIEDAVRKVANQWASLPGGVQNSSRTVNGQPMDMSYFMRLFNKHLDEEKAASGL